MVRATTSALALLVVVGVGTLLAAPGAGLGATAVAVTVAALTLGAVAAATALARRLTRALTHHVVAVAPAPDPDATPSPDPTAPAEPVTADVPTGAAEPPAVPTLTRRENEVLGLLAEGASNAGIAAQLVLSERTVDAHLRSVFTKLGLEPDSVVNRRVRAARIWLETAARGT